MRLHSKLLTVLSTTMVLACGLEPSTADQDDFCPQESDNSCRDLLPALQADPGITQGIVAYGSGGSDIVSSCEETCSIVQAALFVLPLDGDPSDEQIETDLVEGIADSESWIVPEEGEVFIRQQLESGDFIVCTHLGVPVPPDDEVSCVELTLDEGEIIKAVKHWNGTAVTKLDGSERSGSCHLYVESLEGPMNRVGDTGGPCFN